MNSTDSNCTPAQRFRLIRLAFALSLGILAIFALPSIAAAKDKNHDRLPDRWENRHNLTLKVKQTRRDQDRDGLRNLGEFKAGTNPRKADTDNDGVEDGDENAGTITSFDGTTLTIKLFDGTTISGEVTDETEVNCGCSGHHGEPAEAEDDPAEEDNSGDHSASRDRGRGHEGGGAEDPGAEDPGAPSCSVDDLIEGAKVEQATLRISSGGAVFEEVELAPADPTA